MKDDRWGARADYEVELTEQAQREAHDRMECPKLCPYCLDWLEENYPERNKESEQK